MTTHRLRILIISLLIPQLAGLIGAVFTSPNIASWYNLQAKPALAPPNWVFGPVWTTLFILMGLALYLVWSSRDHTQRARWAYNIFGLQLILNVLWSALFFGMRAPAYAFVEVILFWFAILVNAIVFYKISKLAGLLLIPYLLWVGFASYLNYEIWQLNKLGSRVDGVMCTMEARQCPDGSYVGRQGPKCEFAKCPGTK